MRHQLDRVMDVRRTLLNARDSWYPIILQLLQARTRWFLVMQQLHRFMIAVSWVVVNHDGWGGSTLIHSFGIEVARRSSTLPLCLARLAS